MAVGSVFATLDVSLAEFEAYELLLFPFLFQTAALAQKNSEATRALAAQEDILEKELGEIQKALLAMQVDIFCELTK